MNDELSKTKADYLRKCRNALRQNYGEPVYILITQAGDPTHYPNGAWFDRFLNEPMQVVGVDEEVSPPLYVMANGETVPFTCAELLNWIQPRRVRGRGIQTQKKLYSHAEILEILRLAFPDIPDEAELVVSRSSPFLFADGTMVWLELFRFPVDDHVVEFVAGVHHVRAGKFYVVALDNGQGECITVTRNAEIS